MGDQTTFAPNTRVVSPSWTAGQNASDEFAEGGLQPMALELPDAFAATTTCLLFLVGTTAGALDYLRDHNGNIAYVTVAATNVNKRVGVPYDQFPGLLGGWPLWQIAAATGYTGTPTLVAQTPAPAIKVLMGKVV